MTSRRRHPVRAARLATLTLAVVGLLVGPLRVAAVGQERRRVGIIGAGQIGGTLGEH